MAFWMWAVAGASLIGVWLNIEKNKIGFLIWIGTNIAWAVIDFSVGLTAQGVLFVVYAGLAVRGYVVWRKGEKDKKDN